MLTVELVELGFGSIEFMSISIGNKCQIDDISDSLIGEPYLCNNELSTICTETFVIDSEVHPIVTDGRRPNKLLTLFRDLREEEYVAKTIVAEGNKLGKQQQFLLIDTIELMKQDNQSTMQLCPEEEHCKE